MLIHNHNAPERETWREGVETQMRVSAMVGSHQICIFEQWCQTGLGAPTHLHAVEEVLEIISGTAEVSLDGQTTILTANHSVVIPAGIRHSFRNMAKDVLHVRATIASPVFEGSYDDQRENAPLAPVT